MVTQRQPDNEGGETGKNPGFRVFGRVWGVVVSLAVALSACSNAKAPVDSEQKSNPAPNAPKLEKGQDAVVQGCLAEYPREGSLRARIDPQRAWKICMDASGNQSGLCDTSAMLPLDCAVCIAKGKGLPLQDNWIVRLEFIPAPKPKVLWMLSLADVSMQMSIDAHSGELVARNDQRKSNNLDAPRTKDPQKVAMGQQRVELK